MEVQRSDSGETFQIGGEDLSQELREYSKWLAASNPVDPEVLIQREHKIGIQFLRQNHERGVGEVHRQIRILIDQFLAAIEGYVRGWHDDGATAQDEFEAGGHPSGHTRQQVSRFGENGLGGDERARRRAVP